MNILQKIFYGLPLLYIPLAIILDRIVGVPQPLLFFLAAVAIFPLAALAGARHRTAGHLHGGHHRRACERHLRQRPGVDHCTGGSLKAGLYDMVKASIIGAILANMLLALGAAFFAGGLKRRIQSSTRQPPAIT